MGVNFTLETPGSVWIEQDGRPTREFWELIHNLYQRTGGTDDDVEAGLILGSLSRLEAEMAALAQRISDSELRTKEDLASEVSGILIPDQLIEEGRQGLDLSDAFSASSLALQLLNIPFGGLYVNGGTTAESTTDATPRLLRHWDGTMPAHRMEPTITADTIVTLDAGYYLVGANVSYEGTTNKTFAIEIYLDSTGTAIAGQDTEPGVSAKSNVSCAGIVQVQKGASIGLYHWSTDGGTSFTMNESQLFAVKIPTLL